MGRQILVMNVIINNLRHRSRNADLHDPAEDHESDNARKNPNPLLEWRVAAHPAVSTSDQANILRAKPHRKAANDELQESVCLCAGDVIKWKVVLVAGPAI